MIHAQTRICLGEWAALKKSEGFWDTSKSANPAQIRPWDDWQKKENLPYSELCRLGGSHRENQRKQKQGQVLGPYQWTKTLCNRRVTVIPIMIGVLETDPKGFGKGTWRVGNRWTNRDHPIHSIFSNTENSPGDLRKLDITWTPEKNYQLRLMREIRNNNNNMVQEVEVWTCEQVLWAQSGVPPVEWDARGSRGFLDTNG